MAEAQWLTILDSLDVAVTTVDVDGTVLFVNEVAAKNLSGTRETLVGKSLYAFFPKHAAATRERIRQTATSKCVQHFEAVVKLPDGTQKYFDSAYCPTLDDCGNAKAIQIVARDVTHLRQTSAAEDAPDGLWKRATDDLSMTAERLAAVISAMPIRVAIHDLDTTFRYINFAPAGREVDEVIGTSALAWLSDDDRRSMMAAFSRVIETGEVSECEATVQGRQWLSRLVPLTHEGEVIQILNCTIEVTELKRLEAQLRHRQRLESLGTMAGGIAHDFNNLLTTIAGNLGLAQQRWSEGHDPASYLANIDTAFGQAAGLCKQMLAYAGQDLPARELTSLNAVAVKIAELARAAVGPRARLVFDLADELPAVLCSPSQVGQVILNLIANAADAIGDGDGEIRIATDVTRLEERAACGLPKPPGPGRYVRLRVEDTGGGIDSATLPRIFDPFYSTKSTGHGMGLSVVLGIISSHGAAIQVDSRVGEGTAMTVWFPAQASVPPRQQASPTAAPTVGGERTILVVDDDTALRRVVAITLAGAGYRVVEAKDGDDALAQLAAMEPGPDAMLVDLTMPKRDGFSTIAALRTTHPTLPVLLSSGRLISVPEERSEDAYFSILQKPYRPAALIAAIEAALRPGER